MNENLVKALGDLLVAASPLFVAFIGYLSAKLASYISANTKNALLKTVLLKIDDVVFTVVKEVEQTIVKEIKKASEDGKITEQEKAEIKRIAVEKALSYLSLSEIMRIFGLASEANAKQLVSDKIEAAVHDKVAGSYDFFRDNGSSDKPL